MFALGVGLGLVLLVIGVPIFIGFALGAGTICYYHLHVPWFALSQVMFESTTKYILLAIPLYILAANLMVQGGLAQRLADVFLGFVGHWKGGLAIALILTEGFFSAISGSILASIVTIGGIFIPLMVARGYDRAFVGALVASVAGIDALIPPSNAAIIYCAITGASVSKAFAAGIVPGIFQMLVLMGVCRVLCRDMTPEKRCSWRERGAIIGRGGTALLMPVVILGGIYSGIFTPTEAAAVACLYAAVVSGLIHGELGWSKIWKALESTALTTSVIFAIIAASSFLSVILAYTRIPQQIAQWCLQMGVGPMSLLLAVALASLILGTFLEAVPNMYVIDTPGVSYCLGAQTGLDATVRGCRGFYRHRVVDAAGLCGCLHSSGRGPGVAPEGAQRIVPYLRFGFGRVRALVHFCPGLFQLVAEPLSSVKDDRYEPQ